MDTYKKGHIKAKERTQVTGRGRGSEGHLKVLETAEEALAELQRNTYDLIIVDYKLPGLNGLEFLRRLPESSAGAITLLITAYLTSSVVAAAGELQVQGVLEKPFSSEAFFDSLSSVLGGRCQ